MGLTMKEKKPIYREYAKKYQCATKREKTNILNELIIITEMNRKYLARLLRMHGKKVRIEKHAWVQADICAKEKLRGRKKEYDQKVFEKLKVIWEMLDFMCGKRLAPIMEEALENIFRFRSMIIDEEVRTKLLKISASSIDRLLKPERQKMELKGRSGTRPGTLLKHQIAIRTHNDWTEDRPGFMEIDLVGHEGGNPRGDFAQTLDMTDIHTGWTETFAMKNKAAKWVVEGIDLIRKQLPFDLLGIDSDTGAEFINHILIRYCNTNKIVFTRGRTAWKNDNCYVEQKNNSIVRQNVGYLRYDTDEEVVLLNELYSYLRLFTNHFQPTMQCAEKIRIGSKVRKKYDKPVTPYRRVLESPFVSAERKEELINIHNSLNILELRRNIIRCQNKLRELHKWKSEWVS